MPMLENRLNDGYIHNWLVAGPARLPVAGIGTLHGPVTSQMQQLISAYQSIVVDIPMNPIERDRLDINDQPLAWRYQSCYEDHLVHANTFCPVWEQVVTWAYTEIHAIKNGSVEFEISTQGCVEVWINAKLVHQHQNFSGDLETRRFQVELDRENKIWVRLLMLAGGACENQMALRLLETASDKKDAFTVMTPVKTKYPHRLKKFEQVLEKAYLEEIVSHKGSHINLCWTQDAKEELTYAYHVQDAEERNYVEGSMPVEIDKPVDIGHPQRLWERRYQIVLCAPEKEYWAQELRYKRALPHYVLDNPYSSFPVNDYGNRRIEALKDATKREPSIFAEIAKMGLEQWGKVEQKWLKASLERVNRREVGSVVELVGLLGMIVRYAAKDGFPQGLKPEMEAVVLDYRFSQIEPGDDAMSFDSESDVILFAASKVLAGQLYPDKTFTRSGLMGSSLREQGESEAMNWLRARGTGGFAEWNSNQTAEWKFTALTHLASLSETQALADLAVAVMDKMLFLMAVNSIRGISGTTHGQTGAGMIKSGQIDALAGLSYVLWGMGVLNANTAGTVSLVLAEYEFPAFFADIAGAVDEELVSRECHAVRDDLNVNNYLYRTPDYLLSSAQNYRPGEKGCGEHIWQATMGPEAVVFSTHPGSMSEDEACLAGFWRGNACLPRVAQWKNALIAVYNLPENEWLDFTHAYFPVPSFDEFLIENGWAIARKGAAYLALAASQDFELVGHGPDTNRELRAKGRQCVWVCLMGRQSVDGSFEDFKTKIWGLAPEWQPLGVSLKNLNGELLTFGWEGALEVSGETQAIDGFKHMANPYTTTDLSSAVMDISCGEILMRLNFE